jgi:VWFA-related protein
MQGKGVSLAAALFVIAGCGIQVVAAQEQSDAVFRAHVDLVSVTAVVRDRQGRVVKSLTRDDFQIIEEGEDVPILDLQADDSSPATVALLVDGSGSMRLGAALDGSRRISESVLRGLNGKRDAAALFSFDTRLITLHDFTNDFHRVRRGLDELDAWGSTSLYDAIAGTAGVIGERVGTRRAMIVLTDGGDTTSTYSPEAVAGIASTIDVPVYVFALGTDKTSALAAIARATGGELFVARTDEQIAAGIAKVLDELRHQYVFAFNGSESGGVRQVEIRTRKPQMKVTSRKWYRAGSGD